MPNTNVSEVTKVRFDLWAVLAFLVLGAVLGMGYLFNEQGMARERVQSACDRITVLEQQFYFIKEGIVRLETGQKELTAAITRPERVKTLKGRE
jgi:hypothetical protein